VSDPRTDRTILTTRQYASGANLAARAALYRWQSPEIDFPEWVLSQRRWSGEERALDVGCGYGVYLGPLRRRTSHVVGLDLATGILGEAARSRVALVNGDAHSLPLRDATFDVALAAHMLYHVPDIAAAVAELRRVLRHGGEVLVATNGPDDKPEIIAVLHRAAGRPPGTYQKTDSRFLLDDAMEALGGVFDDLRVAHVRTEITVPGVEPVIAYVESIRTAAEPALAVDWPELLRTVGALVQDEIDSAGSFRVTTHAGVVVAS
jgi:SAM-dependent methyltransferase